MMYRRGQQDGFTLLEAIVALVLISTTGMALLSWINTQMISLNRVQEVRLRNAATQVALEYLSDINPTQTPNGEVRLGLYEIHWDGIPMEEPKNGIGPIGGLSFYRYTLYETQVEVRQQDKNEPVSQFSVRLLGYEQFMTQDQLIF